MTTELTDLADRLVTLAKDNGGEITGKHFDLAPGTRRDVVRGDLRTLLAERGAHIVLWPGSGAGNWLCWVGIGRDAQPPAEATAVFDAERARRTVQEAPRRDVAPVTAASIPQQRHGRAAQSEFIAPEPPSDPHDVDMFAVGIAEELSALPAAERDECGLMLAYSRAATTYAHLAPASRGEALRRVARELRAA